MQQQQQQQTTFRILTAKPVLGNVSNSTNISNSNDKQQKWQVTWQCDISAFDFFSVKRQALESTMFTCPLADHIAVTCADTCGAITSTTHAVFVCDDKNNNHSNPSQAAKKTPQTSKNSLLFYTHELAQHIHQTRLLSHLSSSPTKQTNSLYILMIVAHSYIEPSILDVGMREWLAKFKTQSLSVPHIPMMLVREQQTAGARQWYDEPDKRYISKMSNVRTTYPYGKKQYSTTLNKPTTPLILLPYPSEVQHLLHQNHQSSIIPPSSSAFQKEKQKLTIGSYLTSVAAATEPTTSAAGATATTIDQHNNNNHHNHHSQQKKPKNQGHPSFDQLLISSANEIVKQDGPSSFSLYNTHNAAAKSDTSSDTSSSSSSSSSSNGSSSTSGNSGSSSDSIDNHQKHIGKSSGNHGHDKSAGDDSTDSKSDQS